VQELAKANTTVIVPMAQIENHGLYLPVATDLILAREICRKAAEKNVKAVVGPSITLGNCSDYSAWPGYIVVKNLTFLEIVEDYLNSLKEQGFHKAVFYLMHGGHNFNTIDIAVSENNRNLGMKVQIICMNDLMASLRKEITDLLQGEIHPELALVLDVKPDLVKRPEAVGKMIPPQRPNFMNIGRYYDPTYTLDKIAPDGMIPFSEKATAAVGAKLLELLSSALAENIIK